MNYEGASLGPLAFNGDTALQFRRDVLKPFFDQYLKRVGGDWKIAYDIWNSDAPPAAAPQK